MFRKHDDGVYIFEEISLLLFWKLATLPEYATTILIFWMHCNIENTEQGLIKTKGLFIML